MKVTFLEVETEDKEKVEKDFSEVEIFSGVFS